MAAGGRALVESEATEGAVRAIATAPTTILHFATHAIVDARSATRAAIVLRPSPGNDGLLDAEEIATLRIPAQLVVLAGCSTGSGLVFAGEGMQGLIRPLFDAGTESVVASHWAVRDAAAEQLMAWFYDELTRGQPTAIALRRAQLRARREGVPANEWAGWMFTGDPGARTDATLRAPAPDRSPWQMPVIAVGALLALSVGVYRTSTRRDALRS